MRWLRLVAPLAMLAVVLAVVVAPRAGPVAGDSQAQASDSAKLASSVRLTNAQRARDAFAAMRLSFSSGPESMRENYPSSETYSSLWPYSQALIAANQMLAIDPTGANLAVSLRTGLASYWDERSSPPGYAASPVPPVGDGERRYFDDNDWTGLALVQLYRQTGDPTALAQAEQVLRFVISGWDGDPTHGRPGGVWWSQQMPNLRFAHRNTVSTAAGAELALRLYDATGRSNAEYLDWGRRMYEWVQGNLLLEDGEYGDHVDMVGNVDGGVLTYNQGIMIGSAVMLYQFTGESSYLATARSVANATLAKYRPLNFSDQPIYNAIFFRNVLLLQNVSPDPSYLEAMATYADSIWNNNRDSDTGLFRFSYRQYPRSLPETRRLNDQAGMVQIFAALAMDAADYQSLV